jgi:hypothetical protein
MNIIHYYKKYVLNQDSSFSGTESIEESDISSHIMEIEEK